MKTQAWGWLGVAVVAAGLNAIYHDGGLEWVHRIVGEVGYNSAAVLALATGRADQFMAEAQMVSSREETASCRWATTLARVESRIGRADHEFAHVQSMSAREEAQLARLEANRARIEARVAARTARLRIAATAFNPAGYSVRIPDIKIPDVKIPEVCPRVRVNTPRAPMVRFPAPAVHIELPGAGPV